MKKFLWLICFVFAVMLLTSPNSLMAVYQTPLVPNGDFDSTTMKVKGWNGDNVSDGGIYIGVNIPGWASDGVAADSGVETPGSNGTGYRAFLMGGASTSYPYPNPPGPYADPSAYDTTAYTIQPGDQFMLSFDATNNYTANLPPKLRVSVYALNGLVRVPIVTEDLVLPNTGVSWVTYTLNVPDTTGYEGKMVGVEIQNIPALQLPGYNSSWINVDNVRFVPEPATWTMLVLGGLAMLIWRRRR